jgi:hypothetical protein
MRSARASREVLWSSLARGGGRRGIVDEALWMYGSVRGDSASLPLLLETVKMCMGRRSTERWIQMCVLSSLSRWL